MSFWQRITFDDKKVRELQSMKTYTITFKVIADKWSNPKKESITKSYAKDILGLFSRELSTSSRN